MKDEVLGFDEMKELYDIDPDFFEAWRECIEPNVSSQMSNFDDYFIQEAMFFKGI